MVYRYARITTVMLCIRRCGWALGTAYSLYSFTTWGVKQVALCLCISQAMPVFIWTQPDRQREGFVNVYLSRSPKISSMLREVRGDTATIDSFSPLFFFSKKKKCFLRSLPPPEKPQSSRLEDSEFTPDTRASLSDGTVDSRPPSQSHHYVGANIIIPVSIVLRPVIGTALNS